MTTEPTPARQHTRSATLTDLLYATAVLATELNAGQARDIVDELRRHLVASMVRVMIAGSRKAGKSTVVNRLADTDVVATTSVPTTGGTTIIRDAVPTGAYAIWADGRQEQQALPVQWEQWASQGDPPREYTVHLRSDWLARHGLELIDTAGIDESLSDFQESRARAATADVVLLVLSAHAALSRTESEFLHEEILAKHVRAVILVSHLDQVDDPDRVLNSVRHRVGMVAPGTPVLAGPGRAGNDDRLGELRLAVESLAAGPVRAARQRQVIVQLAAELEGLTALAGERARQHRSDRDDALARQAVAQLAVEEHDDAWRELGGALRRRQRQLIDRVLGQLEEQQASIVDTATRALAAATEPAAWWSTGLPHLMRQQLLLVAGRLDEVAASHLADDGRWLVAELAERLDVHDHEPDVDHLPVEQLLPTAAGTHPRAVDDTRRRMVRDVVQTFAQAAGPALRAAPPFRAQAVVVVVVEPVIDLIGKLIDQREVIRQRSVLGERLPAYVDRSIATYGDAIVEHLTEHYRSEIDRLHRRWTDWRTVHQAVEQDAGAGAGWSSLAERARDLHRQLHLLDPRIDKPE